MLGKVEPSSILSTKMWSPVPFNPATCWEVEPSYIHPSNTLGNVGPSSIKLEEKRRVEEAQRASDLQNAMELFGYGAGSPVLLLWYPVFCVVGVVQSQ